MSIREGLGYELRSYDPCFNFNADNFSCSQRGFNMFRNVLISENSCGKRTPSLPYEVQFANRNYEEIPLEERVVGLTLPNSFNFPPQGDWHVFGSRMPVLPDGRGIYGNVIPCTSVQQCLREKTGCCLRNVCN